MDLVLTDEQRRALASRAGEPVRVMDPQTNTAYVLLREDRYQELASQGGPAPRGEAERLFLLREFGRRAGWEDPAMDVYDDLDPRRQS